jgi:hypothetical protein
VIPRASWASVVMAAASSLESRTASLVVPAPSFANASPNSSLSMEARVTVLLSPPDRPLWAFVVVEQQQQLKTRGAHAPWWPQISLSAAKHRLDLAASA